MNPHLVERTVHLRQALDHLEDAYRIALRDDPAAASKVGELVRDTGAEIIKAECDLDFDRRGLARRADA
jgi:hypothetical protein